MNFFAGTIVQTPNDYLFEKECDVVNKCTFNHGIVITEISSIATSNMVNLPTINTTNDQPLPIIINCTSKCKVKGRKLPFDFSKIIVEGPQGYMNFAQLSNVKIMGNQINVVMPWITLK